MKRCNALILILFSVSQWSLADGVDVPLPARLIVVADQWCPYNCEPGSDRPGYLIELMQQVFRERNQEIEYRLLPWQRALNAVEQGLAHAAVGAVAGNHGQTLIGKESLGYDETVFITRHKEAFTYKSPANLDPKKLAVIRDYTYANNGPLDIYLQQRLKNKNNITAITAEEPLKSMFRMLQRRRIDTFPENRFVALYNISNLGLKGKVAIVSTPISDRVYVGFSPDEQGRANLQWFDQKVAQMKQSGALARIMERYGIEETEKESRPDGTKPPHPEKVSH